MRPRTATYAEGSPCGWGGCVNCNFTDNADRVGGTNVSLRSLLQRQAVEERAMCQLAYSSNIS